MPGQEAEVHRKQVERERARTSQSITEGCWAATGACVGETAQKQKVYSLNVEHVSRQRLRILMVFFTIASPDRSYQTTSSLHFIDKLLTNQNVYQRQPQHVRPSSITAKYHVQLLRLRAKEMDGRQLQLLQETAVTGDSCNCSWKSAWRTSKALYPVWC